MIVGPGPTQGAARVARGVVLALASAALAVAAHAAAGARLPDIGLTVVLTVALAAVATALADRQRGPLAVLALAGGGQLALHVLLTGLARRHHGDAAAAAAMAAPGAGPLAGGHSVAMLLAHGAATLLVGGLLAGAEHAVFLVAVALAAVFPRRLTPPLASAPLRLTAPAWPPVLTLPDVLARRLLVRRGPPVVT